MKHASGARTRSPARAESHAPRAMPNMKPDSTKLELQTLLPNAKRVWRNHSASNSSAAAPEAANAPLMAASAKPDLATPARAATTWLSMPLGTRRPWPCPKSRRVWRPKRGVGLSSQRAAKACNPITLRTRLAKSSASRFGTRRPSRRRVCASPALQTQVALSLQRGGAAGVLSAWITASPAGA
jgi:hypothetical protein